MTEVLLSIFEVIWMNRNEFNNPERIYNVFEVNTFVFESVYCILYNIFEFKDVLQNMFLWVNKILQS